MPRLLSQLPSEILESVVLPKLPAKSIGRLRCFCKSWNSFLSTPKFARTHLPYQTTNKLLLLDPTSPIFRTLDCQPLNQYSTTKHPLPFEGDVLILASLDGLLCVALKKTRELAFWNPLTGAYKKLSTSKFFDDMCKRTAFAFYVDSSNDYKLIHIVSHCVYIYSRRLDSWRKINVSLKVNHYITRFSWYFDAVSGEKVYFRLIDYRGGGEKSMMSFDVDSEEFKEIQFPPLPPYAVVSLAVLNGCNHLCVTYYGAQTLGPNRYKCDMWRMMDGDGLIKVAELCNPWNPHMLRQIHTKRNGNWLAIWDDEEDNSFKYFDMVDYFTEVFFAFPFRRPYESKGAIYVETLVSPYHYSDN